MSDWTGDGQFCARDRAHALCLSSARDRRAVPYHDLHQRRRLRHLGDELDLLPDRCLHGAPIAVVEPRVRIRAHHEADVSPEGRASAAPACQSFDSARRGANRSIESALAGACRMPTTTRDLPKPAQHGIVRQKVERLAVHPHHVRSAAALSPLADGRQLSRPQGRSCVAISQGAGRQLWWNSTLYEHTTCTVT